MKTTGKLTPTNITKKLLPIFLMMLAITFVSITSATAQPAPQVIPADMSCGVCGMHPAKFVKWQTQIIFSDGVMVPFDGGKDMFKYILNTTKYDQKHTSDDITAIWVKGFNSGEWLDGHKAVYVVGSKVMGPMGKELIPFNNADTAKEFQAANGGMIKHFTDIVMSDIQKLGMGGMKMKGMKGKEMNGKMQGGM